MKHIFFLSVLITLISCKAERKFFGSNRVCKEIYREKYLVHSGGAWSAELYEEYMTDSMNFRVYIGEHNENSNFDYECSGNSVIVRKFLWEEGQSKSTIINKQVFRLADLKQKKKLKK